MVITSGVNLVEFLVFFQLFLICKESKFKSYSQKLIVNMNENSQVNSKIKEMTTNNL